MEIRGIVNFEFIWIVLFHCTQAPSRHPFSNLMLVHGLHAIPQLDAKASSTPLSCYWPRTDTSIVHPHRIACLVTLRQQPSISKVSSVCNMDVATGPRQQNLLSCLDGRASSQQAFLRNAITFSDSQCKHLLYFLAAHKHLRSSECNMDVATTPGAALQTQFRDTSIQQQQRPRSPWIKHT